MDFWAAHTNELQAIAFLACVALFPRITMLIAITIPGGCLFWFGWMFFPHFTVAILATSYYWHTNPVLCLIAWIFAFAGTGAESKTVVDVIS